VTDRTRRILLVLAVLMMAAVAFYGARLWQFMQTGYTRVAEAPRCDLRDGPCRQSVRGGRVSFSIIPRDIPLMQPLRLLVEADGIPVRSAEVEIRGVNMNMGLNQTALAATAEGRWEGETILPVCSQRSMQWEAAVRLDAGERVEVPFVFHTTRP
jgi:hypothetical protein